MAARLSTGPAFAADSRTTMTKVTGLIICYPPSERELAIAKSFEPAGSVEPSCPHRKRFSLSPALSR